MSLTMALPTKGCIAQKENRKLSSAHQMTHTAAVSCFGSLKTQIFPAYSQVSNPGVRVKWGWLLNLALFILYFSYNLSLPGVYYWKPSRSPPIILPWNVKMIIAQVWIRAKALPTLVPPLRYSEPCQRWTHSGRLPLHEGSSIRFDCSLWLAFFSPPGLS